MLNNENEINVSERNFHVNYSNANPFCRVDYYFILFFVSFTYNFKVVGPEVVSTVHVCWNSDTVTPIIPGVQKNLRTRVNPEFGRKKKNKL